MKTIPKYLLNVLLCILTCAPVITIADSITAMHFVNFKLAEDPNVNVAKEFSKSFKQNFKQSLVLEVLFLVLGINFAVAWVGQLSDIENVSTFVVVVLAFGTILFFMFEGISTYLLAKFDNTVKRMLLLSVYTMGANLETAIKIALADCCVVGIPVLIVAVNPSEVSFTVAIFVCLVLFVACEMLSSKWMLPIFKALIESQERANKRREEEEAQKKASEAGVNEPSDVSDSDVTETVSDEKNDPVKESITDESAVQ